MKLALIATLTVLLTAIPAIAHEVEKGRNGGRVMDAGDHHIELVAKNNQIEVYLSDKDDKPLPATGFKGVAILSIEGKSQRIALEPTESSRLSGPATGKLSAQPKGVVQVTPPGGKTFQARFN